MQTEITNSCLAQTSNGVNSVGNNNNRVHENISSLGYQYNAL